SLADAFLLSLLLAVSPVPIDCMIDGFQQFLVAEWLRQKLDCPGFHRPNRHCDVPVAGDEDDRNADTPLNQDRLKIEATTVRQTNIQDQARRRIQSGVVEELLRRSIGFYVQGNGLEEIPNRVTHR